MTLRLFTFLISCVQPLAVQAQGSEATCEINEVQVLEPVEWTEGEAVGWSVDLHDDWAIMGSPTAIGSMGAVYIFRRDEAGKAFDPTDDVWTQAQRIVSPDGQIGESFGSAVGINADWAVVGSEGDKEFGALSGSVHIFRRDDLGTPSDLSDDAWVYWQKLYGDLDEGDRFGLRLALDVHWFAVSATGDDDACPTNPQCDSGAVYLFQRVENGTPEIMSDDLWLLAQKLLSGDLASGDRFGSAVAIDGSYVAIGASGKDIPGFVNAGASYLFALRGFETPDSISGHWTESVRLTAKRPKTLGGFGISVALHGDRLAVASRIGPVGDSPNGEVHVFRRGDEAINDGASWKQVGIMRTPSGEPLAAFGRALGMASDVIVVSSVPEFGPESPPGAVYLFRRFSTALHPAADELWLYDATLASTGSSIGDYFGEGLAVHGQSALIGSPGDDRELLRGTGYLYFLGESCWDLLDIADFQECVGATVHDQTGCGRFDLARDGVVDAVDFKLMVPTFTGP